MADVIVQEQNEKTSKFKNVTTAYVDDHETLWLKRRGEENKRTIPVKVLWGLVVFDRTIDDTKTVTVAQFARGQWVSYWVDGERHVP